MLFSHCLLKVIRRQRVLLFLREFVLPCGLLIIVSVHVRQSRREIRLLQHGDPFTCCNPNFIVKDRRWKGTERVRVREREHQTVTPCQSGRKEITVKCTAKFYICPLVRNNFFMKVPKIAALFSVSYILCFNLRQTLSIQPNLLKLPLRSTSMMIHTHISMKICQYSLTLMSFQNFFLLWSTKVNFWRIARPLFSTHSKWIKTRPVKLRKDTKEPQKYQYSSYVFRSHATYWN